MEIFNANMGYLYCMPIFVVLLLQGIPSTLSIDSPNITKAHHSSINSIVLEWDWTNHISQEAYSPHVNNSAFFRNSNVTFDEPKPALYGFNVTIRPLKAGENATSLSSVCDGKDIIHVDKQIKIWTFRNLNSVSTYVACVQAVTNTEASKWAMTTIRPEGRRPPGLLKTSRARIYVRGYSYYASPIVLDCLADGLPTPKITWYMDGKNILLTKSFQAEKWRYTFKNNGSLLLKTNTGTYHCAAENKYGVAKSGTTRLSAPPGTAIPTPESSELTLTVKLHDPALLICPVPHTQPRYRVTWDRLKGKRDTEPKPIGYSNRIMLLSNGSLFFANVEKKDEGLYECRMHGAGGSSGAQFRHLRLRKENVTQAIPSKLLFMSRDHVLALLGTTLELHCIFAGWPTPNVTWTKGQIPLKHRGAILKVDNVTSNDAGVYYCKGRNGVGHPFMQSVEVKVESAPRWKNKPKNLNLTQGDTAVFICNASGNPPPHPLWYINGKAIEDLNERLHIEGNRLEIKNVSRGTDLMTVQCNISNIHGYLYTSVYLNVMQPTRITRSPESCLLQYPEDAVFSCDAETDPGAPMLVYWLRNGKRIYYQEGRMFTREDNSLVLVTKNEPHEAKGLTGNYTCVATNYVSEMRRSAMLIPVNEKVPSGHPIITTTNRQRGEVMLYAGIFAAVLIIVLITIGVAAVRKRRRKRQPACNEDDDMQFTHLMNGGALGGTGNPIDHIADESLRIMIREVKIPREELRLGKMLGKGQFGKVFSGLYTGSKGFADERKVAVKTLKYKTGEHDLVEKFLQEAVLMRDFNDPYVLSLIGISFEPDGSPMVVLPFMENGDLQSFIRDPEREVTVLDLLRMGQQVARGMEYLGKMRFVHRDLAARNCMVDESLNVKVADFGLSRDLYSKEYYRLEDTKTCIPVRWMAPESLTYNTFTTMTDVWAYGVLLWELMTRGALPYPDVDNWEIRNYLQAGHRLGRPYYCPDSVYTIMLQCWHEVPEQRPTFTGIILHIEKILSCRKFENHTAAPGTYMNIGQAKNKSDYRDNLGMV